MANLTTKTYLAEAFVDAIEAVHVAVAIVQSDAVSPGAAAQPPLMQTYSLDEMRENGGSDPGHCFDDGKRRVLGVAVTGQNSAKYGLKLQVPHQTSPVHHVPMYCSKAKDGQALPCQHSYLCSEEVHRRQLLVQAVAVASAEVVLAPMVSALYDPFYHMSHQHLFPAHLGLKLHRQMTMPSYIWACGRKMHDQRWSVLSTTWSSIRNPCEGKCRPILTNTLALAH